MLDRPIPATPTLAALCGALLAALVLAPSASAQFEDTTTVVVVEVPVHVIRDGTPVRDLTAADFELFDGRKRQEIIGFEVVDLSRVGADAGTSVNQVSVSGRRHFLLLFDLSLSDPESVKRARDSARRLVLQALHPSDLVAVATYAESRGVDLVLNFTPNRDQVELAIQTLGLAEPAHRIEDPLSLMLGDLGGEQTSAGGAQGRVESMLQEMALDFSAMNARVERDQMKNRVLALTTSLTDVASLMTSVEGRKHVVFLSEGFDSQILTGVEDIERQMELNRQVEFGQHQRVDAGERFGDTQAVSALETMLSEFQRADCAIHAVDIAGVGAGPEANRKTVRNEALFRMARETGGEFYQNYNNLESAMGEVLERTSVTYLLAFQPRDLELDGKFHKLRVKLARDVPGARLVHRPGYYPPKPYTEQSPVERKLSTAAAVLGGEEGGSFLTAALAAPFPSPLAKAYVPVLVEIDGPSFLAGASGDTLVTEIYAYALDEGGTVRDFFARRLGLDLDAARTALLQSGFKYYGHLELEPGKYALRVLVRDAMTGASSLDVVSLDVPDWGAAETALLPPLFPEPGGKWVFGRESEEEQVPGVPYPFMLGEQPYVPAARPVLGRGESAMALVGYGLGGGSLTLSGQLFTHDGAPVDGARVELVGRDETGVPGFDRLIARFSPGQVPEGEYLLVVTVSDLASGTSHTASTEVVVGG